MGSPLDVKTVEQAWPIMQDEIDKVIDVAEKHTQMTPDVYMNIYTIVYNICVFHRNKGPECQKLYDKYNKVFEDYITSKVLSCLVGKEGENLLQEVVTRWDNYKLMTRWMSKCFTFLNRYYIHKKLLPDLQESSYSIFHKLVLVGVNVQDLLMRMIERVRCKEEIDQTLLRTTINMYLRIGKDYYKEDLENKLLQETHNFYYPKALKWINSMDYGDYMTKVEGCIRIEEDKVALDLEEKTRKKLLEAVNYELLDFHEEELEEKKIIHLEAVYIQFLYMKLQQEQQQDQDMC